MAWYDEDSWATAAFAPRPMTIAFVLLLAMLLPILVHQLLYRAAAAAPSIPRFLLVGPSGAGKTALLTLLERNTTVPTHTSTVPQTVQVLLPTGHTPNSSHFRSPGDPAYERSRRFLVVDTPGHGKLRRFALNQLVDPADIRGIIFVVDAATVAESTGLAEAAGYLHDVLLALQKRYTGAKSSKGPKDIPVLIAANKLDLFTALPPHLVLLQLEKAVTEVRASRAKGMKDSGVAMNGFQDLEEDEERDWLGEGGEGKFEFGQMEEVGTSVLVKGGNVTGGDGTDPAAWFEWIAEQL